MDESKLFTLLKSNKWDEFISLLNPKMDLNIQDEQMNYLIQYVINANNITVLNKILTFDVILDWKDVDKKTILYVPIKYEFIDIIVKLLEYDKKNVGVFLLDNKDGEGNLPIHYALKFKNFLIFKMLLPGTKHYVLNSNNDTLLHLSVKTKQIQFINEVINKGTNIDFTNMSNETALHLACEYSKNDIIDCLIKNKANVNIKENNSGFLPLTICILNSNSIGIELLLHSTNLTLSDNEGNTPIHIALMENNTFLINLFKKLSFNYNATNLEGNTCLHIILLNYINGISIDKEIIKMFIKNTLLNIQNNEGYTIIHILIKTKLFLLFEEELVNSHINIFVKNMKGKTPYDFMKELDKVNHEKMLNIVINSYYNRLKNKNVEWLDDWENKCAKNSIEKSKCLNMIKEFIISEKRSIPYKQLSYYTDITEPHEIEYTTFTGINFDVLTSYIDLQKRTNIFTSITSDFEINEAVTSYYKKLGITKDLNNECLNFEIFWIFKQLMYPVNIVEIINDFFKTEKTLMIIPLAIELEMGAHANVIIIDKKFNTVERFEPNGKKEPIGFNYNSELLDSLLMKFFNKNLPNFEYLNSEKTQNDIGFQLLEVCETKNIKICDPGGFCVAWCIWYAEQRNKYFYIHPLKLAKKLMINIRSKNISFKKLIRNYSSLILKTRNDILKQLSLNINDVRNDNLTEEQKTNLKQLIKLEIY